MFLATMFNNLLTEFLFFGDIFDNFDVLGPTWDHFGHQDGLGHHPDAKLQPALLRFF